MKKRDSSMQLLAIIKSLNDGTVYADEASFQTGALSYRHGMRNAGQSIAEARNLADALVRRQYALAQNLLTQGLVADAYFQLSIGLHTLQDATSPAHAGFQVWSDHVSLGELILHADKELTYPGSGSNLQRVTNELLDLFNHNAPLPAGNLLIKVGLAGND